MRWTGDVGKLGEPHGETTMTEAEWFACNDARAMLAFVRDKVSGRKLRLFAVARCRQVALTEETKEGIELAERIAEGLADFSGRKRRRERPFALYVDWQPTESAAMQGFVTHALARKPFKAAWRTAYGFIDDDAPHRLLCEILGNPFRRVVLDLVWLARNDGATRRLAEEAVYEQRELAAGILDPIRLAILADALEEAGCANAELLAHLRGPGPHYRGCWAVDAVLGKD
jgi:hypothetical protein